MLNISTVKKIYDCRCTQAYKSYVALKKLQYPSHLDYSLSLAHQGRSLHCNRFPPRAFLVLLINCNATTAETRVPLHSVQVRSCRASGIHREISRPTRTADPSVPVLLIYVYVNRAAVGGL